MFSDDYAFHYYKDEMNLTKKKIMNLQNNLKRESKRIKEQKWQNI